MANKGKMQYGQFYLGLGKQGETVSEELLEKIFKAFHEDSYFGKDNLKKYQVEPSTDENDKCAVWINVEFECDPGFVEGCVSHDFFIPDEPSYFEDIVTEDYIEEKVVKILEMTKQEGLNYLLDASLETAEDLFDQMHEEELRQKEAHDEAYADYLRDFDRD